MADNDIRFSGEQATKEEAEENFRLVNQLFTGVEYKHVSIVRLVSSPSEVMLAFGDFILNPSEKGIVVVRPIVGLSMSHQMARQTIGYLQAQIDAIDAIDAAKTESTALKKKT